MKMTSVGIICVRLGTIFSFFGLVQSMQPEPILLDVEELKGVADFRSVRLSWKYHSIIPPTFSVKYCEVVAWGKDKCITQLVNSSDPAQINAVTYDLHQLSPKTYQVEIGGLRLATNYTFEVQPTLEGGGILPPVARARSFQHNEVTIITKGFSANPRLCLGDRSEVDIETGPLFGGHISVEGAFDKRCTWLGDPRDATPVHTFIINHEICGGVKKEDRIETIIIVSESRSIITHTARRFMVVCNLLPETFTIKASIHIPSKAEKPNEYSRNEVPGNNVQPFNEEETEEEESFRQAKHRSHNRRIASQQSAELQQVAHLFQDNQTETTTAHLVLMVLLVVAAAVGVVSTVWWFVDGLSRQGQFNLTTYEERNTTCDSDFGIAGSDEDRNVTIMPTKGDIICDSDSYPSLGHISCIGRDADDYCATTLVLAPSMSAAFNSNSDSHC